MISKLQFLSTKIKPLLLNLTKNVQTFRTVSSSATNIKEKQIVVDCQTINYVEVGKGKHVVLCFPGALGTIWSDFKPQIERLDKNEFTIIAWDPPGYGKSRPPCRKFTPDFYCEDAVAAHSFMQEIGQDEYSVLGWSDGGNSGMIMAAKYPESIKKLVIWGCNSFVKPEEIKMIERIRDISKWSEKMRAPLVEMYTEEGLQDMWNDWCDVMVKICNEGDICKNELPLIKCPTLILHGNLDPVVDAEHHGYLLKHIKRSQLHIFPEGKHNIHLRYADTFNEIVTRFLLSC